MAEIRKELLDILACPKCKAAVRKSGAHIECTNASCGLRYPIRDGIPIMLLDEAEPALPSKSGEAPHAPVG